MSTEIRHLIGGTWKRFERNDLGSGTNPRDSLILGAYRPDSTTTGLIDPSILTITSSHYPVSGTTYQNLDVRNSVTPNGSIGNVTYKNCIFRGDATMPASYSSMYGMFRTHLRGFVFEDCEFAPQNPNYRWIGMQGYGFTLRRCDIHDMVDAVEVFNANAGNYSAGVTLADGPCDVVIEQCYFHDLAFFQPGAGGGETSPNGSHSDCIQWEGCTGLIVRGNYFTGLLDPIYQPNYTGYPTANSSMQIKPDVGAMNSGNIELNWFGGGSVTINIADAPAKSRYITNLGNLSDNRFYQDQEFPPTNIKISSSGSGNPSGIGGAYNRNVHDSDNSPVSISRVTI